MGNVFVVEDILLKYIAFFSATSLSQKKKKKNWFEFGIKRVKCPFLPFPLGLNSALAKTTAFLQEETGKY